MFLIEKDFSRFFGGIEKNSTGHIIGAKATYINWFSEANLTAASLEKKSDPSRQGMGLDSDPTAYNEEYESDDLRLPKMLNKSILDNQGQEYQPEQHIPNIAAAPDHQ